MSCSWDWIDLPAITCRYGRGALHATLGGTHGGFRLDLSASLPDSMWRARRDVDRHRDYDALFADPVFRARVEELEQENRSRLPARDAIEVALVIGDERVAIETPERVFSGAICKGGSAHYHTVWPLPWPAAALADLAIAIRVDADTRVIALPYGLCRDEAVPATAGLARSIATHGQWVRVQYTTRLAIGPYHATLYAASAEPGTIDVEVYREAQDWTPPDVSVAVDGRPARRLGEWREPDFMRRVARFDVATPGERRLATLTTRIDDKSFDTIVPASLL